MIRTSDSVKVIAAALLTVQKDLEAVTKSANNPYFKSKYADLNSILDVIKEPLNKAGITILQFPDTTFPDTLGLTTRFQHSSGEFMEAMTTIPLSKSDPQAFGAAVTYARRYALQAIIGLQAVDDDAEAAVEHSEKLPPTKGAAPKTGGFKLGQSKPKSTPAPARGKTGVFPTSAAMKE